MSRSPQRPGWVDSGLYPFADRWLDVDGCLVHYLDEGDGPPLLMLHGNPTWSFLYRDIVRDLADRFRCVAVDYPGFGLSTARDGYGFTPAEHARVVERLVLELDLDGYVPVVQDWGGPIGLWVAGRHPERVAGVVAGNTMAWPMDDPAAAGFSWLVGGPIGTQAIRRLNAFVEIGMRAGVRRRPLSRAAFDHYRGPFPDAASRRPIHVLARQIVGARPFLAEVERGLEPLRELPALIVWGDADIVFRDSDRARLEGLFPLRRSETLAGAGHFIQEDAPGEIAAAIRSWHPAA